MVAAPSRGAAGSALFASVFLLVLQGTSGGKQAGAPPTPLLAGSPRAREQLSFEEGQIRYSLQGLRPGSGYEVKVSYPASTPAEVDILFAGLGVGEARGQKTRRLLNVEKLVFATDDKGHVQGWEGGGDPPEVIVQIRSAGVYVGGKGEPTHLVFNIALAEVYFGALPAESVPVVAAGLSCLALVACLSTPWAIFVEGWVERISSWAVRTKEG